MSETELRKFLLASLKRANAFGLDDETVNQSFISGNVDISFENLDMDSLSRMEFCIAIETEIGVSVTPRELERFRALEALARHILAQVE